MSGRTGNAWMDAGFRQSSGIKSAQETSVNLPLLAVGPGGPVHLDLRLSRATLEQKMQPLVDRTREPVKKALADGKRSVGEIQEVVRVGGSTRIPMVKKPVKKVLRQGPAPGRESGRAGSAVGAAIPAGVLLGDVKDMVSLDVTPLSSAPADEGRSARVRRIRGMAEPEDLEE